MLARSLTERLDEREHASVFDPVTDAAHQGRVIDAVKARLDASLVVNEDMVDFDMRGGVRGFAQLATGPTVYSDALVPGLPDDAA